MAIMSTSATIQATKLENNQEVPLNLLDTQDMSVKEDTVDEGTIGSKEE